MLEVVEDKVNRVFPMVKDLERNHSELRSTCFAKDNELIFMHAEVSRLKEVASKLESKEVDLQSALSGSKNLKNELDELQGAHSRLVEENAQLKNEKVGHEVAFASCQADFYKLGFVDHLQTGRRIMSFPRRTSRLFLFLQLICLISHLRLPLVEQLRVKQFR